MVSHFIFNPEFKIKSKIPDFEHVRDISLGHYVTDALLKVVFDSLYFCCLQVGDDPPGRMVSTTKK